MCDCITKMDEHLKSHNSKLQVIFPIRNTGGLAAIRVHIPTEKINPRNRAKMGAVATFCPFCGTKYEEGE